MRAFTFTALFVVAAIAAEAQTGRAINASIVTYKFASDSGPMPAQIQIGPLFDGDAQSYTFGNLIRSQSYGRWPYEQTISPIVTLSGNRRCLTTSDIGSLESAAKAVGFAISPGQNTPVIYWLPTGPGLPAPCDNTIRSGQSYILQSGSIEHLHTIWTWGQGIPMAQYMPCQSGSTYVVITSSCSVAPGANRTFRSASGQGQGGFTAWERRTLGIFAPSNTRTIGSVTTSTPFTVSPLATTTTAVQEVVFSALGIQCEFHQPGIFSNIYEQDGLTCYQLGTNKLLDMSPDGQFSSPYGHGLNKGKTYNANGLYLTVTDVSPTGVVGTLSNTPPPVVNEQEDCSQSTHGTEDVAVTGPNCEKWTLGLRYSSGSSNFQALRNAVHVAGGYGSKYLICGSEVYLYAGGYFRLVNGAWQSIGGVAPCSASSPPPPPPPPPMWTAITGTIEQNAVDPKQYRLCFPTGSPCIITLRQDP